MRENLIFIGGAFAAVIALSIAFIVFFALAIAAMYPLASYTCYAQWRNSGMEVSFGFMQGCQIKTEHGWIPAENYRGVQVQ